MDVALRRGYLSLSSREVRRRRSRRLESSLISRYINQYPNVWMLSSEWVASSLGSSNNVRIFSFPITFLECCFQRWTDLATPVVRPTCGCQKEMHRKVVTAHYIL